MTDEFKEALDKLEATTKDASLNEWGTERAMKFQYDYMETATYETIRKALLICSRLQQEPSEAMIRAGWATTNESLNPHNLGKTFTAQVKQLMKECDEPDANYNKFKQGETK